jgi:hypothetical protein
MISIVACFRPKMASFVIILASNLLKYLHFRSNGTALAASDSTALMALAPSANAISEHFAPRRAISMMS